MNYAPFPPPGDDPDAPRLELSFPCSWSFTLIVTEEEAAHRAALAVLGERSHRIRPSRTSKGGKYLSFHVELEVRDEADRVGLGTRFHAHPDVRFVL